MRKFDYIIGMDSANIRNLNRMLKGDPEGKIYKFLTFAGSDRDIADPWYTGDFDATYEDVLEGCVGFQAYLKRTGTDITKSLMSIHFRLRWKERTVSVANLSVCWRNIRAIRGLKKIYFPGRNGSKSLGNDFLWFSRWNFISWMWKTCVCTRFYLQKEL